MFIISNPQKMKCVQCHKELKIDNFKKFICMDTNGVGTYETFGQYYYCTNDSMYTVRGVGEDGKETDIPHRCPMYHILQIGE